MVVLDQQVRAAHLVWVPAPLPRPWTLPLAGVGDVVEVVHPTCWGRGTERERGRVHGHAPASSLDGKDGEKHEYSDLLFALESTITWTWHTQYVLR